MGGQFKVLDKKLTKGDPTNPATTKIYDGKVWGNLSDEPVLSIREKDGSPRASFGVRFKRHTFCNCVVLKKDEPFAYEIASRLHKGDPVEISGRLREYQYTITKGRSAGKVVQAQEMRVHTIIPMRLIAKLMEDINPDMPPDIIAGMETFDEEDIGW